MPRADWSGAAKRIRGASRLAAWLVVATCWWVSAASAQSVIRAPATDGDQLIYFFDTRDEKVTYLAIANPGPEALTVEIAIYTEELALADAKSVIIEGWGSRFIDLAETDPDFAPGVDDHYGLVVVTPIKSLTDASPVVPLTSLAGSFTIANADTGSAFGENALARWAVNLDGERAVRGAAVDGVNVTYQRIVPKMLALPRFLDPAKLTGTRLTLTAFKDKFTDKSAFRIEPVTVSGKYSGCLDAARASQAGLFHLNGATLTQGSDGEGEPLESLNDFFEDPESGGSLFFEVDPNALSGGSLTGVYFQSLDTYGAGQRLVSVPAATPCQASVSTSPTTTPLPTPTPTPGVCGDGTLGPGEECDGADLNHKTCQLVVSGYTEPRCGTPDDQLRCNSQCQLDLTACRCECVASVSCITGPCGEDRYCPVP